MSGINWCWCIGTDVSSSKSTVGNANHNEEENAHYSGNGGFDPETDHREIAKINKWENDAETEKSVLLQIVPS